MIANDHPIMRVGLRLAVRRQRDMEIVRETIEEFQRLLPDVIILDLDSLNRRGPDTVQGIRHWSQAASTIVVSAKS
jgi:DNA-binding NarL/FixJ family response regulator